jgi:hypothetical protein
MNQRRHLALLASVVALIGATVVAPSGASAAVTYSPLYWELLDRYASAELSVEYTGAPFRGVYYGNPAAPPEECEEACGDMIAVYILRPDGSLSTSAWMEDPAAPDGWREVTATDCQAVGMFDFGHPNWWVCWGVGYL